MRSILFTRQQRKARVSEEIEGALQAESATPMLGGGDGYLQRGIHLYEQGAAKSESISDTLDRTGEVLAVAGAVLALVGQRKLGTIAAGAAATAWGVREVFDNGRKQTSGAVVDLYCARALFAPDPVEQTSRLHLVPPSA